MWLMCFMWPEFYPQRYEDTEWNSEKTFFKKCSVGSVSQLHHVSCPLTLRNARMGVFIMNNGHRRHTRHRILFSNGWKTHRKSFQWLEKIESDFPMPGNALDTEWNSEKTFFKNCSVGSASQLHHGSCPLNLRDVRMNVFIMKNGPQKAQKPVFQWLENGPKEFPMVGKLTKKVSNGWKKLKAIFQCLETH